MRPLSLSFQPQASSAALGYGLLAVGGLVLALVIAAQVLISREMDRHAVAAPAATAKREPGVLPRGVASEADAMAGALTVVSHLAGPGEKLFVTLEAFDEPGVALLSIVPDTRTRTLRIQAEAKDERAMLAYLRVLEQSRAFTQVALVDHEVQENDPLRPLRFRLAAAWGP